MESPKVFCSHFPDPLATEESKRGPVINDMWSVGGELSAGRTLTFLYPTLSNPCCENNNMLVPLPLSAAQGMCPYEPSLGNLDNFLSFLKIWFKKYLLSIYIRRRWGMKEYKACSLLSKGLRGNGEGQWFSALDAHSNCSGRCKRPGWDPLPMFLISLAWGESRASVFFENSPSDSNTQSELIRMGIHKPLIKTGIETHNFNMFRILC